MSYKSYCAAMRLDEMIELPNSALKVYLHIMHMTNAFGQNGTVNISDSDLAQLTHLAKQSVTDAKKLLQQKGFIHCERGSGGVKTRYRLLAYQKLDELGNEPGEEVGQTVGTASRTNTLTISNDNKKPPPPTLPPPTRVRECALIGEQVAQLQAQLGDIAAATRQLQDALAYLDKSAQVDCEEESSAYHDATEGEHLPRSGEDEALWAIIEDWESRPKFAPLGAVGVSRLRNMLKEPNGYAKIKAAMDEAELANKAIGHYNGVSFVFFQEVFANLGKPRAKPKRNKSPEPKGVKADETSYSEPVRTGNEPWRRRREQLSA